MTRTKYEFMHDMLVRARNRHRRELGLPPEQPETAPATPEPIKASDGQAEGSFGRLCGNDGINPMPLGGEHDKT